MIPEHNYNSGLTRRAYKATSSFLRRLRRIPTENTRKKTPANDIRIAFIHNEKRITTGAHHINEVMSSALARRGAHVKNFYPRWQLTDAPSHMRGIASILFFHSLLEKKNDILRYNIIQGTTFTPLPFLSFKTPLVSHFGSTTFGFLLKTPKTSALLPIEKNIWRELHKLLIIPDLESDTIRALEDIANIETLVAKRVTRCIDTSELVQDELISIGIEPSRIKLIHNAIEDYWFEKRIIINRPLPQPPHLIFLGRLGTDVFTLKLKGLDRLIRLYRAFPDVPKTTIFMTANKKLKEWLRVAFPLHYIHANVRKDLIPDILSGRFGSILYISSRYEGFSLSLIEGMSQGLVPITYAVGVAPEIIKNGENGFIVSSHEEAEMIVKELLLNAQKRLTIAEAAQKTTDQFKSDVIAEKLLSLYREIKEEHVRENIASQS